MLKINQASSGWSTVKCPCGIIPITVEQVKGLLRKADKNGDGSLSTEELEVAFRQLGAVVPAWRAWRALIHADKDGDGQISKEEVDQLVAYIRKLNFKNPGCRNKHY